MRNTDRDISPYLKKLADIKKNSLSCRDYFQAEADDKNNIAVLTRDDGIKTKIGVFSLLGKHNMVNVSIKDGNYVNLINGETVTVENHRLLSTDEPIIIST